MHSTKELMGAFFIKVRLVTNAAVAIKQRVAKHTKSSKCNETATKLSEGNRVRDRPQT